MFIPGEVFLAVGTHLRLGQVRVFLDDHQLHGFTGFGIRYADAGTFQHTIELGNHVFQFGGVDVEAADQHHVFFAVNNLEEAALIHDANVA